MLICNRCEKTPAIRAFRWSNEIRRTYGALKKPPPGLYLIYLRCDKCVESYRNSTIEEFSPDEFLILEVLES